MSTFDVTKIWFSMCTRRYIQLCPNDINTLTEKIYSGMGGKLQREIPILLTEVVKCRYDVVVIKGYPCVLISVLGEGSYGKVYESWDLKRNKKVAVKCQPGHLHDIISKQAAITRCNGIGLFDSNVNIGPAFLSDNNGYFILPLADSCFHTWISTKVSLNQNDIIVKALIKIAQDLQTLHANAKVHLDLKSDNVLIIKDVAYLSDFGKTESRGVSIKSVAYDYTKYPQCAPEYFSSVTNKDMYEVSPKFDLYSYGFLLKNVSKTIKNPFLKKEILSISTYTLCIDPNSRKSLSEVIIYLRKLLPVT